MEKLKVAVIGLGWFGNVHLDNLLKIENVEIAALVTANEERLAMAGKKVPDARRYRDHHEMFEKEVLDAVVICVTPSRHGDIELICCEKGIPFYVEKPIGLDKIAIEEIATHVREQKLMTAAGYQERYNPAIQEIKEIIQSKPVGNAYGSWMGGMPGSLWWRTKALSGGQAVEQTTHIFDMLRYLLGDVHSVYAAGGVNPAFGGLEHDVEDYSSAVLTFKSGMTAVVQSACYINQPNASAVGFKLYTRDQALEYDWGKELRIKSDRETLIRDVTYNSHFAALESFIQAISQQDPSLIRSTYEDAAKSCLLTLAVNQSLSTGEVIIL